VARYLQQMQDGPHRMAADIVEGLGENVALATLCGIAEELGGEPGGLNTIERRIAEFDAVRHVAQLELPRAEVRQAIDELEFLRETGLAMAALLKSARRAGE
jgi:hypothetical protein